MSILLPSGFEVVKFSDLDYDGMTVEIQYKGVPVAQISHDKGIALQEIAIPTRFSPENCLFAFNLNEFLEVLKIASDMLREMHPDAK
jgi:hypothetical protein